MFVTSVSTNRGKEGWVIQTSYGTRNEQPYSIYQIDCFFSLLPIRMLTSEFNNSVIMKKILLKLKNNYFRTNTQNTSS